ncbi:MAG: hypothetical protein LJF30_15630 [Acidobacteria bacterium]|jgi:hypothetical protein|nr:hypothetical protein [Acidobacteriota bacterium]
MSRRGTSLALAAFALLALPAVSTAQGIGDAAARARQERESQGSEGKKTAPRSYSNDDLEGLAERTNEDSEGTVSTTGVTSSSAGPAESRGPTREEGGAGDLERFEEALTRAQGRVQTLEAQVEDLQQRLNPMSTTYVYGGTGGPVGATQADEERRVRRELAVAERQLAQAREAVTSAENALARARRAGPVREEGY